MSLFSRSPMHLRLAALLLALPCALPAQEPAPAIPARRDFAHAQHVRTEFHAPSGWTIVELLPLALRQPPTPVELRTSFRFPGRAMQASPDALTFAVVSQNGAPLFATKPVMTVARDGGAPERVAVQAWRRQEGARVHETVYATMPRATFLRLTSAARVVVTVDTLAFALDTTALEALRDLASRMSPAGFRHAAETQGIIADLPASGTASAAEAPVYETRDVDQPIRPRGPLARPAFPSSAPREPRRVHFRYVVDTLGRVELASLRGETPVPDAPFVDALRMAAARWRFEPARKDGRRVRQQVRQVLAFDPAAP